MESKEIVLDEGFLNTCMNCGGYMESKMYEYYCSKKCEEQDHKRILKGIEKGKHPIEILSESKGMKPKEVKKDV